MTMNHLPPQAYTKETLVKAYEWLTHQSPQIKDMAINTDILISLYRKAQMHGEDFLERPSIQNFKNELKNLAGMMGEFQDPAQKSQLPGQQAMTSHHHPSIGQLSNQASNAASAHQLSSQAIAATKAPAQNTSSQPVQQQSPSSQNPTQSPQHGQQNGALSSTSSAVNPSAMGLHVSLDAKTLEMIREVKVEFNLSHENEAIRMLISTGYKKIKTIL